MPKNQKAFDGRRDYWGAIEPFDKEFAQEVIQRFDRYQRWVESSGLRAATLAQWKLYHSRLPSGQFACIRPAGARGELLSVPVNEYRPLIRDQLELITSRPLSFQAMAKNDDDASLDACLVTEQLIEHYAELTLERLRRQFVEIAQTQPAAWLTQHWNPLIGPIVAADVEESSLRFGGDIDYRIHTIETIAYPQGMGDLFRPEYFIERVRMSRYLLAENVAKDKEEREAILDAPVAKRTCFEEQSFAMQEIDLSDYVDVHIVSFGPSSLLDRGRIAMCLGSDRVLIDGPNPYSRVPCTVLSMAQTLGMGDPHCDNFDLYALMLLQQKGYSTLASHLDASHQVIWTQDTPSSFGFRDLGPFKVLFGKTPPQMLQLFNATREMFAWPETIRQVAQRMTRVSDAVRGMTSASESGKKVEIEREVSKQHHGGFARVADAAMGDVATLSVEILAKNVTSERVVAIVGQRQASEALTFTGAALAPVERVRVVSGDPMADTPEAREALAKDALDRGWIQHPDQYVTARRTGNLDVVQGGFLDMGNLVRNDMETLKRGEMPVILTLDDHQRAIDEARDLLKRADIRRNPQIRQLVEGYAAKHAKYLTPGAAEYSPALMAASRQQPLAPAAAPGGAPTGGAPGQIGGSAPAARVDASKLLGGGGADRPASGDPTASLPDGSRDMPVTGGTPPVLEGRGTT